MKKNFLGKLSRILLGVFLATLAASVLNNWNAIGYRQMEGAR